MTAESEQQLENDLIKQLCENGYERVIIPDVDALMRNFRNIYMDLYLHSKM